MASEKRPGRISKPLLIIAILVLLVLLGILGWNFYKDKFIRSKVRSSVYEKTNGLYIIRYDKMDLDEVGGYLHVTNLQVIPDTAKFREMVDNKKNPPLLLELTVPELTIAGVKTPEAMLNKKVSGRKLEINNATVRFYFAKGHPDTTEGAPRQEMYQQLLGDLKEIQADTVEVNHVSLAFIDILNYKKTIEASNVSVHLHDVLIDSLHSNDSARFFFAKHVQIHADTALVKNKPGTYHYVFTGIDFSKDNGTITMSSLRIAPQFGEEKFAALAKLQTDRFNVVLKNIEIRRLNLRRVMQTEVIGESVAIKSADFKIFRDRSYPRDQNVRVGTFPQQMLMKAPFLLSFKKVTVADAFVEYKEKNPKSDYSGKVQFTHASAVISNVTNEASLIKSNKHCVVDFNARFLDMAPMHARLDLFLNDPKGLFGFRGSMGRFEANKLNVLIEPMGLARIDNGIVNKVDFDFMGYNYGSNGKVIMLYNDLKLTLLKKDDAEDTLKKKKLASFVANMVVKNANPSGKKPVRIAHVHYDRDTHFSFFNLMWKSIFTGVKQSAGM